jgi:hypothetical protein
MKTSSKSLTFILGICLLLSFNVISLFSQQLKAQAMNQFLQEDEFECKWQGDTCPDGNEREVCVKDGHGDKCTCGTVTCSC